MAITNKQSGTNVQEIADEIYRINTPVNFEGMSGGFSFNQYLILDDEPLIFHTGPRKMFPLVRDAVASVLQLERLRYIHKMDYFSHTKYACDLLEKLVSTGPETLGCMHGSAWRGDGAKLLRALANGLSQ